MGGHSRIIFSMFDIGSSQFGVVISRVYDLVFKIPCFSCGFFNLFDHLYFFNWIHLVCPNGVYMIMLSFWCNTFWFSKFASCGFCQFRLFQSWYWIFQSCRFKLSKSHVFKFALSECLFFHLLRHVHVTLVYFHGHLRGVSWGVWFSLQKRGASGATLKQDAEDITGHAGRDHVAPLLWIQKAL